eukprot:TRINITY_DN6909_c0_g1_i2.p1 TRINITY_DN6909_c0_g1~~TRINITY_DN6909_c0_g1_i2.p1  ORF type:complete len:174 (-),score=47.93 TRINITY_DN6909_c0_g1_i2:248-769(-)
MGNSIEKEKFELLQNWTPQRGEGFAHHISLSRGEAFEARIFRYDPNRFYREAVFRGTYLPILEQEKPTGYTLTVQSARFVIQGDDIADPAARQPIHEYRGDIVEADDVKAEPFQYTVDEDHIYHFSVPRGTMSLRAVLLAENNLELTVTNVDVKQRPSLLEFVEEKFELPRVK